MQVSSSKSEVKLSMFVLSSATVMLPEGESSCRLRFVWKLLTIQNSIEFWRWLSFRNVSNQ